MSSKGPHTLLEALLQLKRKGIAVHAMLAGNTFQTEYAKQLREYCTNHNLNEQVDFLPQLDRQQLARFFQLNHVCVFPSLHPEAFGIVAAEAMASGLRWLAQELVGHLNCLRMGSAACVTQPGDSTALAERLEMLAFDPALLLSLNKRENNESDITSAWMHLFIVGGFGEALAL